MSLFSSVKLPFTKLCQPGNLATTHEHAGPKRLGSVDSGRRKSSLQAPVNGSGTEPIRQEQSRKSIARTEGGACLVLRKGVADEPAIRNVEI